MSKQLLCSVGCQHVWHLFAVTRDGCSQRVLAVVLCSSHYGQQAGAWHTVALHHHAHLDHLGGTVRDGACLVKHHRLDLQEKYQFAYLIQKKRLLSGFT